MTHTHTNGYLQEPFTNARTVRQSTHHHLFFFRPDETSVSIDARPSGRRELTVEDAASARAFLLRLVGALTQLGAPSSLVEHLGHRAGVSASLSVFFFLFLLLVVCTNLVCVCVCVCVRMFCETGVSSDSLYMTALDLYRQRAESNTPLLITCACEGR